MPGGEDESVPWTARNSSELTPLINKEVMWLLKIAEDRMKNATGFHFSLKTARHLAMYTSVGYCLHENIRAWNCTRSVAIFCVSKKGCKRPAMNPLLQERESARLTGTILVQIACSIDNALCSAFEMSCYRFIFYRLVLMSI